MGQTEQFRFGSGCTTGRGALPLRQGLVCQTIPRNLAFELDAVDTVLCHGL